MHTPIAVELPISKSDWITRGPLEGNSHGSTAPTHGEGRQGNLGPRCEARAHR